MMMQSFRRKLVLASFGVITILCILACRGNDVTELSANVSSTYNILQYGAIPDGKTLDTDAIQKAIDQCAKHGGGTVIIPQGNFLSGALFLKPGVNLHLNPSAVIHGSTTIADYPDMETRIEGHFQVWTPALINGSGVDHLRLDGEGTIQGGGRKFWDSYLNRHKADKQTRNLDVKRPRTVFIQDSHDVRISGLSVRESGFWNLHLFRCRDVIIKQMDIRTPLRAPSTDGIDVDSCQNVTIQDCYISVDDDNIALKGNKGTSALDDPSILPDDHIHIVGCSFGLGNAALTVGSEATTVRNVVMENCKLTGKEQNRVLALKLRPDTQQDYGNITVRNITVDNPAGDLISIAPWTQYFDLQGRPAPSQTVNGVTLTGITGQLKDFGRVEGAARSTIQNVLFQDIHLTLKNPAVVTKNVENLKFDHVTINGAAYMGGQ